MLQKLDMLLPATCYGDNL